MDIAQLNSLIEKMDNPKISKFNSDGISSTLLPQGDYLYMSLRDVSVMLYIRCETLGEKSVVNASMFEGLLALNIFGGRYHNIRLSYDRDTTVLWLCHDVMLDSFSVESFSSAVKIFIEDGVAFRNFVNDEILDAVLELKKESSKAPSITKSAVSTVANSSSSAAQNSVRSYTAFDEPDRPVENSATEVLSGRTEIPETEEDGMISVMVAQSMFMMA
jgi:hypothetical protein